MTICTATLYSVFPKIKAFGCCHEVFGTQKLLASAVEEILGFEKLSRADIKINVVGLNHFTWLTSAKYKNFDLFPVYKILADKYYDTGYAEGRDDNWINNFLECGHRVKFDLFITEQIKPRLP